MIIDLRSDTVTKPTPEMRIAMAEAVVGDDVYGDDPTILELEALGAEMLGKEAALFVASGTMGNQTALMSQTQPTNEVILPETCHILEHEAGAAALLSGVQMRCLPVDENGLMDLDKVEATIRKNPANIHSPTTALLHYEQADSDGRVMPLAYQDAIRSLADRYQLRVHIDGARLFNAATALGVEPARLAAPGDTVSICLSKGLAAPIGSLLLGSAETIKLARRKRKMLGGGWRQAGVLAAAGLIALRDMSKRLDVDHANARYLAEQLQSRSDWFTLDRMPEINLVFFHLTGYPLAPEDLIARLEKAGVLARTSDVGGMRWVTHNGVTREMLEQVIGYIDTFAAGK